MRSLLLLLAVLVIVPASQAVADSGLLNDSMPAIQFKLTNGAGQPVTGTISVTYRYYIDSTGGPVLGTGSDVLQPDPQGLVTTRLRGLPPVPPGPIPNIHDQHARFVELEFPGLAMGMAEGTSVILPRIRLTPALYSLSAHDLRGGSVTTGKTGLAAYAYDNPGAGAVFEVKYDSAGGTTEMTMYDYTANASTLIRPGGATFTGGSSGGESIVMQEGSGPKNQMVLTPGGLVFQDSLGDTTGFVSRDFGIFGTSCWLCPAGNFTYLSASGDSVGIGTSSPTEKLTVTGPGRFGNGQMDPWGIAYKGLVVARTNADAWGRSFGDSTGIYLPASTSDYSIIFGRTDASTTKMFLRVGDDPQDHIALMPSGNVGVGTENPNTKLDVSGTTRTLGFEMPTGAVNNYVLTSNASGVGTWQAASGGGGSCWACPGLFTFLVDSTNFVGIGTSVPDTRLHVKGVSTEEARVESNSNTGSANITAKTGAGAFDFLELRKWGSSAGGTIAGIPLANLSLVGSGASAGPMMLDVKTNNPMHFATNNVERMRILADGRVGIATTTPSAQLDVSGTTRTLGFEMPTGAANGYVLTSNASGVGTWQAGSGGSCWVCPVGNYTYLSAINDSVGIGTSTPTTKLDITGNIRATDKAAFGPNNSNTGTNAFVVGDQSRAAGNWSTISGGQIDTALGLHNVIGGGQHNKTNGLSATVGGGGYNYASIDAATIAGGWDNRASGWRSTVGGGVWNWATGQWSTVSGGQANVASFNNATVSGGVSDTARAVDATVCGGNTNVASGQAASIGGGQLNLAQSQYGTVGGGYSNLSRLIAATVAGGYNNEADSDYTFVGGGKWNTAVNTCATVAGGDSNTAYGLYSTVPGGYFNQASGNYSFAAGQNAAALDNNCFVWASTGMMSTGANQFLIDASGGVGIGTNNPNASLDVDGDLALRSLATPLLNGANNNVSTTKSFSRIAGPSLAFSVTGLANGQDGRMLILYNSTSQAMTISNESVSSIAANRILTMTGGNIVTVGTGTVTLIYSSTDQRWIVTSFQP